MTVYQILLAAAALNGAVFGTLFALAPDFAIGLFGGRLDLLAALLVRQFGGVILGLALLNWLVRKVVDADVQRAVVVGDGVAFTIVAAVAAFATATGVINLLGWAVAGFHATVAVGLLMTQTSSSLAGARAQTR